MKSTAIFLVLCLLCPVARNVVTAWSSIAVGPSRKQQWQRPSCFSLRSSRTSISEENPTKASKASNLQKTSKPLQSERVLSEQDNGNVNAYFDPSVTTAPIAPPPKSVAQQQQQDESKSPLDALSSLLSSGNSNQERSTNMEYQKGLATIGFITLVFSSNSPVLHAAFSHQTTQASPPVLLLNAAVSAVALVGLLLGGETLEQNTVLPSSLQNQEKKQEDMLALQGGSELGLWKFLGTTANIYGLSLTTASHGAFLIQLTTLIVPVVQGLMGVPIPRRIQFSVVLALAGVVCFTQDPTGTPSIVGDVLCVVAAGFYATYDLRLYGWGKQVAPRRLITGKIATQALLSLGLLLTAGSTSNLFPGSSTSELSAWGETLQYLSSNPEWTVLLPVILWSGVAVNALAPFLQVGGQQAVGPTRCQTIYASQPLWAAIMSFVVFGETIGWQGLVGGSAFLTALFLAATTEAPTEEEPTLDTATTEIS